MILSHKIRLDPNYKQTIALKKACGCSRYAWNWAVAEWDRHYKQTGRNPKINELKKRWNREKPEFVRESPKDANQQPFANLQKAYSAFFNKIASKPKFKSKRTSRNSFYVSNEKFQVVGTKVRLPRIGWVRLREELRFSGKIVSGTISEKAGKWYLSVHVETVHEHKHGEQVLGIDLGLKTFATCSDGTELTAPEPLKRCLKRLQRLSRKHSRKQKGSKNRSKAAEKLARLHDKITNQRQDWLHKSTSMLVAKTKLLVIEDLSLVGMKKRWGRKVSDLSLYEFGRQLEYKCKINGCGLIKADRWFPSTQLCHCCGAKQKLDLRTRSYECTNCGYVEDRDLNAAKNLHTVGLAEINARGQNGSDYSHMWIVKPVWMKQELSHAHLCIN